MLRLAVSLVLAAACAAPQETHRTAPPGATPPTAEAEADPGDEQICTEERTTGSNVTRTVCRSRSQVERDREDAQQFNAKTGRMLQKEQGN